MRRIVALLVLAAFAACERTVTTAPDATPEASPLAPSFSVQAAPDAGWSGEPVILDFESLATDLPIAAVGPTYSEDGYTLSVSGDGVFSSNGSSHPNYAGSAGLFLNNVLNLDVVLTRDDGTLFNAQSIDLSPLWGLAPGRVTFVGTRADGSTVTQTHVTGRDVVFEPFSLDGFTSLVELRWTQRFTARELHQFDEIVLSDARAESKEDCFDGGWEAFGFRNQGECIRVLNTGRSGGK